MSDLDLTNIEIDVDISKQFYVVCDRVTREVLSYAQGLLYRKNVDDNQHNIVYYDKHFVLVRVSIHGPRINTIAKKYLESSGLFYIEPGQKQFFSEEAKNYVDLLDKKEEYLKKGLDLVKENLKKLEKYYEPTPLSGLSYTVRTDKHDYKHYADMDDKTFQHHKILYEFILRAVCNTDACHHKFKSSVKSAKSIEELDDAIDVLRKAFDETVRYHIHGEQYVISPGPPFR